MESALAFAEEALERGDYSQCLNALEEISNKHPPNSPQVERVKMLMITAWMGKGDNENIVSQIVELLDTRVRPAVAMDGGDIVFHGFEEGVVYLHMQGACSGCPSSTVTLKMGIENLLRHYVPEVQEVQAVP